VKVVRGINPYVIRYPSEVAQQMGVGTFFFRLGAIGMMALLAHAVVRLWPPPRFSVMRVFGQTSLLVYWVHVELVYGLLFKHFANRLSMAQATVAFVLMTAAMLGLSLWRLKYWRGWRPALEAITRALGGKGKTSGKIANLPSSLGPL
jgi:fucose 4-O-acetylase-like acetyltransferase